MAWSVSVKVLVWVLVNQFSSQAFGTVNDTSFQTVVRDFSLLPGKIFSERPNPTRRDLRAVDTLKISVFLSSSTFIPNYEQMLENFKIYVYPRKQQDFGSPEWCGEQRFRDLDKQGALFYESLINSDFSTDDPEKAHLFFLPFSIDALAMRSSVSISRFLRRYVDDLRAEYPYWTRTLGADHFYYSCEGVDIDSSRNVVELKKNAIQISCYPLPLPVGGGNARFYPHKDITMPPIESVIGVHQTLDFQHKTQHFQQSDRESRTILAYHVGSLAGLDSVLKLWKSDPDFVLDPLLPEPYLYYQRLSSSRFCLNFFGDGGNSSTLLDALTFGCIPVIISQGPLFDLPFQDILNWQEFVVIMNLRQVGNLKKTLQKIPETQFEKMKNLAVEASKHLRWHSTPQPYDAFYSLMYQLWLRRHTIRYARRHISN